MTKEYFPQIQKIEYEGKESKNVLAFHYYQPEKEIMGKKMKDWLRFAMAWWHTLGGASGDQFGGQTRAYEWEKDSNVIERAKAKMDAGFEIMQKLGIEYFCFHDIDKSADIVLCLFFFGVNFFRVNVCCNIVQSFCKLVSQRAANLKMSLNKSRLTLCTRAD